MIKYSGSNKKNLWRYAKCFLNIIYHSSLFTSGAMPYMLFLIKSVKKLSEWGGMPFIFKTPSPPKII